MFVFEEAFVHIFIITWMRLQWQRVQPLKAMDQALYTPSECNYGSRCLEGVKLRKYGGWVG